VFSIISHAPPSYWPLSSAKETKPQPELATWIRYTHIIQPWLKVMTTAEGVQYSSRFIACIAKIAGNVADTTIIQQRFRSVDNFVAAVRIVLDGNYFLGPKVLADLKRPPWEGELCITQHVFFALSDIAATLDFVNAHQLLDLSTIAISIGSATIFAIPFSMVVKFMVVTALLGYIIWGVECALKAYRGDHSNLNTVCIARCVSELFNKTFTLAAGSFACTAPGLAMSIFFSTASAGLAVLSVYHNLRSN
jgi:hypothetical protein